MLRRSKLEESMHIAHHISRSRRGGEGRRRRVASPCPDPVVDADARVATQRVLELLHVGAGTPLPVVDDNRGVPSPAQFR
jgi:carbamate kinase